MKIKLNLIIPLIGLLLLFGCGGGGSSSHESPAGSTPKAWGTAELIESNDVGDADNPQIAIDANGNAIAIWKQSDGSHINIYANRFDGTTWGTEELIETGDLGDASAPQIAIDADGNAVAVWSQNDGSHTNIYANRFDGTDWGTAELIETGDGTADGPQIAIDADGNAIAAWQQNDGSHTNIYANHFDGTAWGTAELIETTDTGDAGDPQISIDADGNAIVVWSQNDGTRPNIYSNRFDGTDWGTAELIETDDTGDASTPQIAIDADGNAIAVWQQGDGSRTSIYANRFYGTSWGTAELIEIYNLGDAGSPQIAINADGNAIAIWQQNDGSHTNIYTNHFDGTDWGTAKLIETNDAGDASTPQIAFDADGNAIAVWKQFDGSHTNIYTNRYDGTDWGTAELIETDDTGDASTPQIAIDADGNAIAVWQQNDGSHYSIWANRFE